MTVDGLTEIIIHALVVVSMLIRLQMLHTRQQRLIDRAIEKIDTLSNGGQSAKIVRDLRDDLDDL